MAKLGLMALLNLDITRFENNMKKASRQTDMMGTAMKSLGGFVAGAFSIAAIGAFIKAGYDAYQKQLEAETRLQSALGGREDIMRRLADQADTLEGITLFDDDTIITAQSFFATLGLGEDAIRQLTPLVIDFAARFGMDLQTATMAVSKAISGNGKAFKDLGFEIEGAAGSSKRFDSVLQQLNQSVAGQAAELGKLPVNQIKALGVAWDNFKEDVVANNAPFILAVLKKLTDRTSELKNITDSLAGGGAKTSKDVEDSEFDKYAKADEESRKVILKQWQDFYNQSKENYEKYRELESYGGTNRTFFAGQMMSMDILIKKAKEFAQAQTTVTKVDHEAIDAANKLAEARLKASQAKDREFISSIGYKDKTPKADFGKNTTDQAIMGELDKAIEASREIPEIINRSTVNMQALTAVSGQQITIWQQLGEAIQEALEKSVNFEDVFMQMVNSNIKGVDEMGKAMWNMARQIVAAELAKTIGAAVSSAMESVPFPFNILAAGAAAAAAGTLFNNVVPQLAGGGIATAPTLAMVGEYPGARSNPEVIAPLDKLSAMLGGSNTVNVQGRLMGADILISSERFSKQRTRVRGF